MSRELAGMTSSPVATVGYTVGAPSQPELCNGIDDDCDGVADTVPCLAGCADGEREGFTDGDRAPLIAGCAGGFGVPGIPTAPACDRGAGDDGVNPEGTGCAAADLCAAGWHVCATAAEVGARSGEGECTPVGGGPVFFASAQSGPGATECGAGTNDLFGCGSLGVAPAASCLPLDRFSCDLCVELGPSWSCGADGALELTNVTKPDPGGGGVLCCRDDR